MAGRGLGVEVVAGVVPHPTSVANDTATSRVRIGVDGVAHMIHRVLKGVYDGRAGATVQLGYKLACENGVELEGPHPPTPSPNNRGGGGVHWRPVDGPSSLRPAPGNRVQLRTIVRMVKFATRFGGTIQHFHGRACQSQANR